MTVVRKTSKRQAHLDFAVFLYMLVLMRRGSQHLVSLAPKSAIHFVKFWLLLFCFVRVFINICKKKKGGIFKYCFLNS